ncbi:MAG TPA: hypothetical protein ENN80_08975 [Candidatus Hydrogenedentes bacterium]|nr:hypothetical protein [Candidatus Hydrogenedentota bacterium]
MRAACGRLVEQLRAARYDCFAVMFDSNQLIVLAALTGAAQCLHGAMDGRLEPLPSNIIASTALVTGRALLGHIAYAAAWLAVYLLPVGDAKTRRGE